MSPNSVTVIQELAPEARSRAMPLRRHQKDGHHNHNHRAREGRAEGEHPRELREPHGKATDATAPVSAACVQHGELVE
eukprot:CAMPEP_0113834196 /NCGR_PEP_ID=MMETSP0328-20130328/8303_1 /TAXON_ID=39455 /ORGANISM="Alexandrium minutum" /LENGTH=77 /DNA_ID=CAMNT_0000802499 /DNA_START=23 /DNA_END=257 /DNA_ORIENTATION=- /assembly_acc=CAM_ASM_000350